MNVLIDDREYLRVNDAITYFSDLNCNCKIEELNIGDFIFNDEVVFEFKTLQDFISSVKDGRVFNQTVDQLKNFKYHFVIIVSDEDERERIFYEDFTYDFSKKQFYGAIARLNTYTTVLQADTLIDAFDLMYIQSVKCLDNRPVKKHFNDKTDNMACNWLSGIKRIGDSTAELLCDELKLVTLNDLFNLELKDLTSVEGIGKVKAELILNSIK